jgi:hypothetical protein
VLILHVVSKSLVRCTPARIGYYWSKYTPHSGLGVSTARSGGMGQYRDPLNPQGFFFANDRQEELKKLIQEAAVIHCHDDHYPTEITKDLTKVMVYHAHIGDIPERIFHRKRFVYHSNVKHACITNGYGRMFDREEEKSQVYWGRLPDILDIWNPIMMPNYETRSVDGKIRVVFTFSNTCHPGSKINAKAPCETKELIQDIPGMDLRMFGHVSFRQSMDEKRNSHIVLDEIFSPYMHLSSLEGACVGACVLVNYDRYTRNEICNYLGAPIESFPFIKVSPQDVRDKIEYFRDHRDEATEIGRRSREWMETYYDPKRLLGKYLEFYGFAKEQSITIDGTIHQDVPRSSTPIVPKNTREWAGPPWGPVTNV